MSVRVRYAPSPTGLQHIGGIRSALFNYFFAKSAGGKCILRVEDTDQERSTPEALNDLYESFKWLEIPFDESPVIGGDFGPYIQSERAERYREYAQKLVEQAEAYPCFCSSERLEEVRRKQSQEKSELLGYDRHCREIPYEEAKARCQNESYVIRFKIPLEGRTSINDVILGEVARENRDINPDPVLLKSDGFPTYHLANVVDDHQMQITHVLRAQEWLPTAPLHGLLYESFGWDKPIYCHLPMVMGQDGGKLSKRHGSTSLREFRKEGYLPEAIINYVVMLGWALDGKREFFTREELGELFDIQRIHAAPATFDYTKLQWFNTHYMQECERSRLIDLVIPYLQESNLLSNPVTKEEREILEKSIELARPRLKILSDISAVLGFLFRPVEIESGEVLIPPKADKMIVKEGLKRAIVVMDREFFELGDEEAEARLKGIAKELDMKVGQLLLPIRIALTGTKASPPLIASIKLLRHERVQALLQRAVELL